MLIGRRVSLMVTSSVEWWLLGIRSFDGFGLICDCCILYGVCLRIEVYVLLSLWSLLFVVCLSCVRSRR